MKKYLIFHQFSIKFKKCKKKSFMQYTMFFAKKILIETNNFFLKLPFKNTIELEKNLAPSPKIYK